jgi:hypothetical protein
MNRNERKLVTPHVAFFAGKAAPGYAMVSPKGLGPMFSPLTYMLSGQADDSARQQCWKGRCE